MSNITGSWEPGKGVKAGYIIDENALLRFIAYSENNQLSGLIELFSADEINQYRPMMKLELADWEPVIQQLSDQQLVHLMRFFTCAEMQLTDWDGGSKSPVIHLFRILRKQRAYKPESSLLAWIKSHTNNRFLPYGSVL